MLLFLCHPRLAPFLPYPFLFLTWDKMNAFSDRIMTNDPREQRLLFFEWWKTRRKNGRRKSVASHCLMIRWSSFPSKQTHQELYFCTLAGESPQTAQFLIFSVDEGAGRILPRYVIVVFGESAAYSDLGETDDNDATIAEWRRSIDRRMREGEECSNRWYPTQNCDNWKERVEKGKGLFGR